MFPLESQVGFLFHAHFVESPLDSIDTQLTATQLNASVS